MSAFFRNEGIVKENIVMVLPDVYQITYRAANVFLLVEDELTLIDTGYRGTAAKVMSLVSRLGRKPEDLKLVVLTHCHPDHIGSLGVLKKATGARVFAHAADAPYIDGSLPQPGPINAAFSRHFRSMAYKDYSFWIYDRTKTWRDTQFNLGRCRLEKQNCFYPQ